MNLFLAVLVVVAAAVLTIMVSRFFFGAPDSRAAADSPTVDVTTLTHRTIVSAALTIVVLLPLAVGTIVDVPDWMTTPWLQAILITPVMFYGGAPIHTAGWAAARRRDPDMDSLASLGTIAAYAYSLVVCVADDALPEGMRGAYFEVAGVIVTLVLFAQLTMQLWLPTRTAVPLQTTVNRFSRVFVPVVILIALWTMALWLIFGTPAQALLMAVSVLIIACPAALGWAAPLSAAAALENAKRHGMAVHTIAVLQVAARTRTIVTDACAPASCRRTWASTS
ncbi:hypothetical protein [Bifidobacterium cuniculi]|uniref:P-type ATPase n=1 Tax=Bifidobacterium cuniculi TaxID=1688 RepID=UPI00068A9216|nr:hypothetical protein [Bifidobacterium cuniculi]